MLDIGYWINNVHKPNKLPANLMRHLQHKWSIWNSKYQQKNLLLIRTNKYANTFSFSAGRLGPKSNVEIVGPIFLADFLNASLTSRKVLKKNYFQRSGTFILEIWLTNNFEDILQIRLKYEVNWSSSAWDKCIWLKLK